MYNQHRSKCNFKSMGYVEENPVVEELAKKCACETGCCSKCAEMVLSICLDEILLKLSKGESVNLGEGFGTFFPKKRSGQPNQNSPRTPKQDRYKIIFREGSRARKHLKI